MTDSGEALYAIADLHGDYSKAIQALQLAGLVGKDGYWEGKGASLVQLGDLMDRGPNSLDCVNLFQRLKAAFFIQCCELTLRYPRQMSWFPFTGSRASSRK